MSKIIIDAREYSTGTGRYISRLVQNLEKVDDTNDYIILLKPQDMSVYNPLNPRFSKLACPYKEFTFAEQLWFAGQLRSLKADLVHFGMVQQPLLYQGKTVTTIHDLTTTRFYNPAKNRYIFAFKQRVYKFVIKRVARKASSIITPSKFVSHDLAHFTGITADKISVTYEAADVIQDKAEPVPGLRPGQHFIMYDGRPTPHKNLTNLVKAFVLLKAKHPDLLLVLGGKQDTNYQRLEAAVQEWNISDVVFTGFLSEGQLKWLYKNCSAYVFPSLSEGFGLPGLEAMAHGAPVVSSNATCLPEIYGEAAHYFDPLNVEAMANAIDDVLSDEPWRERLAKRGLEQAAKYSWQRMARQTLAVYKQALISK